MTHTPEPAPQPIQPDSAPPDSDTRRDFIVEIPPALIEALHRARSVAVLTGAGISAESGIPTFRDAQTGLWSRYRPEELATPAAFEQNPRLVWEWYAWRRELISRARPNPGHLALAEMETRLPHFTLITQNVDGLHQRAGSGKAAPLIELHGNIQRVKCYQENRVVDRWQETDDPPPRCPHCGGWLRPDVVWFGEPLPWEALAAAQAAARACEIFFSIGTSALVEPAASLPLLALRRGARLVEINLHETPLTPHATHFLPCAAGAALPALLRQTWSQGG
ncbi:MAG: NAD-dependent protein deacylase [Anaerolineae bacterium UTCFX2]|jgi:NAD-dependent deacetylase|nr:NAD-dependent deacylase [Anaerolineales bacterium]OQY88360.1 MAG: NAD-dependent protein deacylase [Anaerolineae bacterium UTCFX2]